MKKLLIIVGLILGAVFAVEAQPSIKEFKSEYGFSTDTVTNTGTGFVDVYNPGSKTSVTVVVNVVKLSGTVAGSIKLQGSLDGTNWADIKQPYSQTSVTAITAGDATASYHWWFPANPFPRYRVTWTGSGTMGATLAAKILSR